MKNFRNAALQSYMMLGMAEAMMNNEREPVQYAEHSNGISDKVKMKRGLKQFSIDGVEVWAINLKNAKRKVFQKRKRLAITSRKSEGQEMQIVELKSK